MQAKDSVHKHKEEMVKLFSLINVLTYFLNPISVSLILNNEHISFSSFVHEYSLLLYFFSFSECEVSCIVIITSTYHFY